MGENSKIEWTDHTFNPWRGCTKVAPGCANCYAEALSGRNPGTLGIWGPNGTRVMASPKAWLEPLRWDKVAAAAGERHRVFCASLADVFEDWRDDVATHDGDFVFQCLSCGHVGIWGLIRDECPRCSKEGTKVKASLIDIRRKLFALIDATPNLDWLLLTKRPQNILRMLSAVTVQIQEQADDRNERGELYRRNVWLGTSISDQATAVVAIPELLKCRDLSPVLFLSAEPLLGPVDLRQCRTHEGHRNVLFVGDEGGYEYVGSRRNFINWVIVGGESGHHARPMHPQWARDLRDQCEAASVPFFFKQWGEFGPAMPRDHYAHKHPQCFSAQWPDGSVSPRVGKKDAGRLLDGRTHDEFPVTK